MRNGFVRTLTGICLICFLAVSCGQSIETTETGYPDGEIQQAQVMVQNRIYYHQADPRPTLPYGFYHAGDVSGIDNLNPPDTELEASRLKIGAPVYVSDDDPDTVYVGIGEQFMRFSVQ